MGQREGTYSACVFRPVMGGNKKLRRVKCYVQLSIVDLKVEVISERDSSEEDGGASHHAASYNSLNCVKEHRVQNLFVTVNSKIRCPPPLSSNLQLTSFNSVATRISINPQTV